MTITRRKMLTSTVSTMGLFGAATAFGRAQDVCFRTPAQPEGPFYPIDSQADENNDLTQVNGRRDKAQGSIIYVRGTVRDPQCNPISDAVVEIWQACTSGRYNHPGDRDNPSALDPNFQYSGVSVSNAHGEYRFKTIVPGHYSAGPGWIRPPHIHFKVHRRGYFELITQMYFAGNQYNDGDLILRRIPDESKRTVVVNMTPRNSTDEEAHDCVFDITLIPVT